MTRDKQIEKVTEFFAVRKNTMLSKGADYATETDVLSNFKYSGNIIGLSKEMQILSLIATKVARLGNLLNGDSTPNNESIDDSILDLGCYTDLLYCARKEDQDKNNGLLDKFKEDGIKAGETHYKIPPTQKEIEKEFSQQWDKAVKSRLEELKQKWACTQPLTPDDCECDCDPNNPPTYKPYYEPLYKVGSKFRYKKEELQYELYNIDDKHYYLQSKAIKRQVSKEEFNNSPDWTKL